MTFPLHASSSTVDDKWNTPCYEYLSNLNALAISQENVNDRRIGSIICQPCKRGSAGCKTSRSSCLSIVKRSLDIHRNQRFVFQKQNSRSTHWRHLLWRKLR